MYKENAVYSRLKECKDRMNERGKEGKLHAKWASEPWRQQHLVKCPLSNTHTNTYTHTHNRLDPNSNKSPVYQRGGHPLDRWRTAGQGLDTVAEGRADLRQLYYITELDMVIS